MYTTVWDQLTGGVRLVDVPTADDLLITTELRPVFYEELDLLGFDAHWNYPRVQAPLLWTSSSGHIYHYRGRPVAKIAGGGLYEKPRIVECEEGLTLSPVDLPAMVEANAAPLDALAQEAIEFVHGVVQRRGNVDVVAVAFSGGKDSLVLLDIARRALPPACFHVVFSDTTMEIPPTLEAVARARARWPELVFHTARCHMDAVETWERFGPPSRIHRWCCAVHKSVPNLLKLREITGLSSVRALVLDGVRAAESENRSGYARESVSKKHATQINASPLLRWSAAEVYLHLFRQDLFLNTAYRYGFSRVGCSVCPVGSKWWDWILFEKFRDDSTRLIELLERYAQSCGKHRQSELQDYIGSGAWRGRAGGRNLINSNLVKANHTRSILTYSIKEVATDPFEWFKVLGTVIRHDSSYITVHSRNCEVSVNITSSQNGNVRVAVQGVFPKDIQSLISRIIAKSAHCVLCRACEVECPYGAILMNGSLRVDASRCRHCMACIKVSEKGCLRAKSLNISREARPVSEMDVTGINRYQHFGLRKVWLEEFYLSQNSFFENNSLGNRQVYSFKTWLNEACILDKEKLTPFGATVLGLKLDSLRFWCTILNNLFYNSVLVKWYLTHVSWGENIQRNDLVSRIPGDLSETTKKNAILSLLEVLKHTPLGEIGLGTLQFKGKSVTSVHKRGFRDNLDSKSVLYSLLLLGRHEQRNAFTLTELLETKLGGPALVFGYSRSQLESALRGAASQYSKFLSIDFVNDLDNIYIKQPNDDGSFLAE